MKNIAVLTSGGDSPGMNSAIRAVARTCAHYDIKCTGIIRGYSGLIENDTKTCTLVLLEELLIEEVLSFILLDQKNLKTKSEEQKL